MLRHRCPARRADGARLGAGVARGQVTQLVEGLTEADLHRAVAPLTDALAVASESPISGLGLTNRGMVRRAQPRV